MRTPGIAFCARRCGAATVTLMEVLVLAVILSGVVALSLPSLSMARRVARRAACGSNERLIAQAWVMYLADHDGRFPKGLNANIRYGGWRGLANWWPRPLNPYLALDVNHADERSARVFRCPADRGGIPGTWQYMEAYRRYGTSYQTNLFLVGPSRYPPFSAGTLELDKAISAQLDPLSLSKVTAERSQVLLLGDFGWFLQWAPPEHSDPQSKEQMEWHGRCDSYNMAFLDGHVQYVRLVKGYYVGYGYCVLPFEGLFSEALRCQGPAPALPDWDGVIDTEDFLRCIYRAGLPDRGPETPTPGVPSDWDNALASDHYGFSADGDVDVYDLGAREWLLDASSKKGTR